jgi:hypothetical protein
MVSWPRQSRRLLAHRATLPTSVENALHPVQVVQSGAVQSEPTSSLLEPTGLDC